MTDFSIVCRSLTSRVFSTVTTAVTVGVAVALLLVLLAMRDAGSKAFERGPGNMDLLLSRDSSPLTSVLNNVFYANPPPRYLTMAEFDAIAERYPFAYAIPNQQGDSYRGLSVMATTSEFFTAFEPEFGRAWKFAQGKAFEREFEVVVGARAAKQTGLRVGDEIFLTHGTGRSAALAQGSGMSEASAVKYVEAHVHKEFTFKIVGVLEPSGGPHDRVLFVNLDSSWILHAHDRRLAEDPKASLTTLADLKDEDRKITGAYLKVMTRPGSNVSAALQDVYTRLRMDPTLMVAQPSEEVKKLLRIVGNVDQILLAMAVVVLVSSGIAIMVALYNSMEQRRRQIAVLRVLGCSRGRLFGLVVTESAMLGVIGAALGVGLGVLGGEIASSVMRDRLGLVIDPTLPLVWVLVVALGAIALASLAGIVPAVMAYRTPVAKNLRPLG